MLEQGQLSFDLDLEWMQCIFELNLLDLHLPLLMVVDKQPMNQLYKLLSILGKLLSLVPILMMVDKLLL